ncbi:MAG: hypothetical protein IPP80_06515 [Ignavibacteria bacterium]|nr:hypothetical protein [Ignavibacteria bacterium]
MLLELFRQAGSACGTIFRQPHAKDFHHQGGEPVPKGSAPDPSAGRHPHIYHTPVDHNTPDAVRPDMGHPSVPVPVLKLELKQAPDQAMER